MAVTIETQNLTATNWANHAQAIASPEACHPSWEAGYNAAAGEL
jgi:hypothetical protein